VTHDCDIGKLFKTCVASRTAHQSKQLGSVYVHQRRAGYGDHNGDAEIRSGQKMNQTQIAYQRDGQYKPIAVLEAAPTQVFTKRHETGFYYRPLAHSPFLRQCLGLTEAPTRLARCERRPGEITRSPAASPGRDPEPPSVNVRYNAMRIGVQRRIPESRLNNSHPVAHLTLNVTRYTICPW